MTLRSLTLTTLFAASLFAAGAQAHDPSLHEPAPAAKSKPTTCEELADTERFSAELADKALKASCDAEAKKSEGGKSGAEEDRG